MNKRNAESPDSVVDAVLSASRVLVAVAARSLADIAEEVTLTQYRTLVVLASRGPQNVASLATHLGVAPATATRMCDRLVRKRLITRTHERGDRRSVRLALTASGRSLVDTVSERRRREIEVLLDAVPRGVTGRTRAGPDAAARHGGRGARAVVVDGVGPVSLHGSTLSAWRRRSQPVDAHGDHAMAGRCQLHPEVARAGHADRDHLGARCGRLLRGSALATTVVDRRPRGLPAGPPLR